jgi:class 3 adenylate cyclase
MTSSQDVERLDEVSLEGHCQLCDIAFDLDLDRAVEATFVPHPDVRLVPSQMFCVGGPARTPHVMAQVNLGPRDARSLVAPPEPGRYRVFVRGGRLASCVVEEGAPAEVQLELDDLSLSPADVRVAPGGAVRIKSTLGEPVHAKLERLAYATEAATAHAVATLGEFRRLFSTDILKRGTPLKVSHVAILFSDLTGSTALYTRAGDAAAFRLVDDHFDVLRKSIEDHRGTVVKTMGDAVMAAFQDPGACLRAAIRSLEAFETFRKEHPYGAQTGLKLGLFAGPCYVVSANGVLDYFGQTVNVASRLQHLADSAEIIVPKSALEGADFAPMTIVEEREVTVKGVEAPIPVVRLRLPK